jgi:hypothetical protein
MLARGREVSAENASEVRVDNKARFRYHKDGKDFGPFTRDALLEHIRVHRLEATTQVFEERGKTLFRLADVEPFASCRREAVVEHERKVLIAETNATARKVQSSHTRRWWIANVSIVAALAAAGAGWWFFAGRTTGAPSNVSSALLRKLDLEEIAPLDPGSLERESTLPILEPKPRSTAQRPPKPKSAPRPQGGQELHTLTDEGVAVTGPARAEMELAFEGEAVDAAAEEPMGLSPEELRSVSGSVASRVVDCVENEARQRADFEGVTLSMWLEPGGAVTGVRLGGGGQVSGSFLSCVKSRLQSVQVPAFKGSPTPVRVPLKVSR